VKGGIDMLQGIIEGMSMLSAILLIVGFILVGIELAAPGLSAPGIVGAVSLIISVFLIADTPGEAMVIILMILGVIAVMTAITLWLFSKGKLVSPFILSLSQTKETGYNSAAILEHLLGKEGIALTDLRPSGIGIFEEKQLDVLSQAQYIGKGTPIVIVKVEGSKLIVSPKI
jgi:membrane-bound ClpP family serine protease